MTDAAQFSNAIDLSQTMAGVAHHLPVQLGTYSLSGKRVGLVVIDEVNGFATVGCGPLAPPAPDAQVEAMIAETDRLARLFVGRGLLVYATLDVHDPDRPEPPYPPHCIRGTGHEKLVPALAWMEEHPRVTLLEKDCINSFVGAITEDRGNHFLDWITGNALEAVIYTGICTDICVMDAVLTLLSARNHGLCGALQDIVVYAPACATYDLPRAVAVDLLGLPATASHPQALTHHLGLYFMASRGAVLADRLVE
jgi:nicotinamidase-related amidase